MINICILQGAFLPVPPLMGGAVEKMWYRLGHEFAREGHNVTQVSRRYSGLLDSNFDCGVRHLRVDGYLTPRSLWTLKLRDLLYTWRALKQVPQNTDVVVTNTFWAPILLRHSLAAKAFVDVARMPRGQMKFYRRVARLRANSSPVAEAIRRELPHRLHEKVVMIPNPLPFTPPDAPVWGEKVDRFLYTGRVHPEKGLHLLIESLRTLRETWTLRVVGPWQTEQGGGGDNYLHRLQIAAKGLPIEFVGAIHDPAQLNEEYRQAKVFVYPSLAEQGETFGLAPLEAMAWGCVPVVSDLACFKDFICRGENGLIFDHRSKDPARALADALNWLQLQPEVVWRLGSNATRVRQSHSPEGIAREFLTDFEKIVASSKNNEFGLHYSQPTVSLR